jgi:hypothetical protein
MGIFESDIVVLVAKPGFSFVAIATKEKIAEVLWNQ